MYAWGTTLLVRHVPKAYTTVVTVVLQLAEELHAKMAYTPDTFDRPVQVFFRKHIAKAFSFEGAEKVRATDVIIQEVATVTCLKRGGGGQRITPMGVEVTFDINLVDPGSVAFFRALVEKLKQTSPELKEFEQKLKKKIMDGQAGKAARKFNVSCKQSLAKRPFVLDEPTATELTSKAQESNIHYARRKFIGGLAKDLEWGARQIQGWWRKKLAAKAVQTAVRAAWSKLWDDEALEWYYYNSNTGESSWEKPHLLREGEDIEPDADAAGEWGHILEMSKAPETYGFDR
jgi:hypothetical protein